ncbi:MAG TPA: pyridoxamine 5'-phosphate oxidase family protein [Longimicrobium sp.]
MASPFHAGELAVQARAGVQEMAARVGRGIHPELWPAAADFLEDQHLAVIAAADGNGAVWASLLTGAPGFLRAANAHVLEISARPPAGDPLADVLAAGAEAGLVAIDLAARRRVRVNGWVEGAGAGLRLAVRQAYGNCPKYIQARVVAGSLDPAAAIAARGTEMTDLQRAWIAAADTFFIASRADGGGADASHRGGAPGFVRVDDARELRFPDYSGNTMFNTLGNLAVDPRCGLLFVDFARGATLQLTGRAEIEWDAPDPVRFPGAERIVSFAVEQVVETRGATGLRWGAADPSPFNPG